MAHSLFNILGISDFKSSELRRYAKELGIPLKKLKYYSENHILPGKEEIKLISQKTGISENVIMLKMGIFNENLVNLIANNAEHLADQVESEHDQRINPDQLEISLETELGRLYQGDCLDLLKNIPDNSVDMVFADPPFNLNKFYLSEIDDDLSSQDYLNWCYKWIDGCVRILKEGGSLFIWNIPKWNSFISNYLNQRLNFKHWITADIKFSLPIAGRLYPSHYALLYYTKGIKANVFHPDRMPMELCPKCYTDLKDYGGYKNKMNPLGVSLTDVWYDIPPVRHKKYKNRDEANELSIKLLDRIIEISTDPGDLIFDPFGGAGTTYVAAEIKDRKWLGVELGPTDNILKRFENLNAERALVSKYRKNYNHLFPPHVKARRQQLNLWTDESFKEDETSATLNKPKEPSNSIN